MTDLAHPLPEPAHPVLDRQATLLHPPAPSAPLTKPYVLGLIRRVVDVRGPGHVYCNPEGIRPTYVHQVDGRPAYGCLVAEAFGLHGIPVEVMLGWDGEITDIYDTVKSAPHQTGLPPLEPDAWAALREAQYAQDSGKTYAEALTAAEEAWAGFDDLDNYYLEMHADELVG